MQLLRGVRACIQVSSQAVLRACKAGPLQWATVSPHTAGTRQCAQSASSKMADTTPTSLPRKSSQIARTGPEDVLWKVTMASVCDSKERMRTCAKGPQGCEHVGKGQSPAAKGAPSCTRAQLMAMLCRQCCCCYLSVVWGSSCRQGAAAPLGAAAARIAAHTHLQALAFPGGRLKLIKVAHTHSLASRTSRHNSSRGSHADKEGGSEILTIQRPARSKTRRKAEAGLVLARQMQCQVGKQGANTRFRQGLPHAIDK